MKITWRIFLGFLIFTSLGFYILVHWALLDVRARSQHIMEETLVDTSRLLAGQLEADAKAGNLKTGRLRDLFNPAYRTQFSAKISDLEKNRIQLRVYVTDKKGIVLFDSQSGLAEGKDYSRWNDVYLTLRGRYGARATRADPSQPETSVLYVAAPIRVKGDIRGVVSVGKPVESVRLFLQAGDRKIFALALSILVSVLVMTLGITFWIALPIRKLREYAQAVSDGQKVLLPKLGKNEMGDLGRAFEQMRETLEGKKYVEQYVQLLTHEIKGPLSAIRGAAELMEDRMPIAKRKKFMGNIRSESARIQAIVDRLLLLSSVESRKALGKTKKINLKKLVGEILTGFRSIGLSKKLSLRSDLPASLKVEGDSFLLRQALSNLIQNALEFSPPKGRIRVSVKTTASATELWVEDEGPGIPSYAINRVFEKFYSLQRPDTGRKSSGLGLSLVKEIAALHGGEVRLENRPQGGALAVLALPLRSRPSL